jgi:acyl carrier protein
MTAEESLDAFERLLGMLGMPQIAVSTGNLEARFERWVRLDTERGASGAEKSAAGDELEPAQELFERPALEAAYQAPEGQTQERLAELWSQLLGMEKVGAQDNFFELGGDSLMATQLVARLRRTFEIEMPLAEFFTAPTVAELASLIEERASQRSELSEMEEALARIKELSDEQAASQLASLLDAQGGE